MEAVVLEFPVSKEEQAALRYARRAYELICTEANIDTGFNEFFDGVPKAISSIEHAVHDAVIYYCFKTLDTQVSAYVFASLLQISSEQLLDIIWQHRKKVESNGFYYRAFIRKLGEKDGIAIPLMLDFAIPNNTPLFKGQVSLVVNAIFDELTAKTMLSREEISGTSNKEVPVRCRTVFVNVAHAIFHGALSLKKMGICIGRDHSTVIHCKKKHEECLEDAKKDYVGPKTKAYWALYNHIASQIEKRLQ